MVTPSGVSQMGIEEFSAEAFDSLDVEAHVRLVAQFFPRLGRDDSVVAC